MAKSIPSRAQGGNRKKQWQLRCIILVLSCYVALDLCLHLVFPCCSCHFRDGAARETDVCSTRNGHYDVTSSTRRKKLNPWNQMKWVGENAACPVKGHLIERMDDLNNFRRGFALKFAPSVEDKTHILPWLFGSRIDLNRRTRRVYLDLGANRFVSSIQWFLRMYPCDFTEVHAFEVDPKQWRPPKKKFDEQLNLLPGLSADSIRVNTTPLVPDWMMDRIGGYFRRVSDGDDPSTNSVDISRFIKQELQLKPSDTVVVKMDIEGAEWPILRQWINDPEMPQIIDELFVEIHYWHPTMRVFEWEKFEPFTREDASRLLADLRWHGFYAHFWP